MGYPTLLMYPKNKKRIYNDFVTSLNFEHQSHKFRNKFPIIYFSKYIAVTSSEIGNVTGNVRFLSIHLTSSHLFHFLMGKNVDVA